MDLSDRCNPIVREAVQPPRPTTPLGLDVLSWRWLKIQSAPSADPSSSPRSRKPSAGPPTVGHHNGITGPLVLISRKHVFEGETSRPAWKISLGQLQGFVRDGFQILCRRLAKLTHHPQVNHSVEQVHRSEVHLSDTGSFPCANRRVQ